ncbi:phosphoribosyltransferase [Caldovatus aquaticus]|uniref:Phosphoribosyltransferase n=1 Tax=Caldovatus aquaticus TaxID=2865671 RepID=A0ABS7F092_9PROT|nr:phosphoribosyltransferase family protein [Caldovatus aquaticus]MBW8268928.1 phosphoribosyltransferase [Caldovatus aquaticus]
MAASPLFDGTRIFRDREEAGAWLAERLVPLAAERPVVLALPRGGVAVAAPIARALDAPLALLLVRKLGAPGNPELAIGAVVDGSPPQTVLNEDIIAALGVDEATIERERQRQLAEIERRRKALFGPHGEGAPPPLAGRVAIVVDDGVATGATARAALAALRQAGVARAVLAVPVIAADTAARLRAEGTEIVALAEPAELGAVGAYYRDFHQLDDAEVLALLQEAAAARRG